MQIIDKHSFFGQGISFAQSVKVDRRCGLACSRAAVIDPHGALTAGGIQHEAATLGYRPPAPAAYSPLVPPNSISQSMVI